MTEVDIKLKWYEKFSYYVVFSMEYMFYNLGKTVAKIPWIVIIISWLTMSLCSLGLLTFYQEKNPIYLWIPSESTFKTEFNRLFSAFETISRKEVMQVVADDVLTPDILLKIYNITDNIRNSQTENFIKWTDVCYKVPKIDHTIFELIKKKEEAGTPFDPSVHLPSKMYCSLIDSLKVDCYEMNILDLWNRDLETISALTKQDIINKINNYTHDIIYDTHYEDLLGETKRNESNHIVSAKSLNVYWMTYFNFNNADFRRMGNEAGTGDLATNECLEWEKEYLKIMSNASQQSKHMELYYAAARSFQDISGITIFKDLDILLAGIIIMLIFLQFVLSKFNWIEVRLALGITGLLSIGMAFVSTCGICSILGLFYGPIHTALPFLLMGLGVDDMFVIMACWDKINLKAQGEPLEERVGLVMKSAGISITVTTVTDVLAFLIGSFTVLPCLQSFCLYAAIGVLLTLINVTTFYIACFTLDQKRVENNRGGVFCCKIYNEEIKKNSFSQIAASNKIFKFVYSNIILTTPGKLCVIGITCIFLGVSLDGLFALEQRYDPRWFIPLNTYLGQYFKNQEKYFPLKANEGDVFIGAVNYTHEFTNIRKLTIKMQNSTDVLSKFDSWVGPFQNYIKTYYNHDIYKEVLPETNFHYYLSKFLFSIKGARFQANFKFITPLKCGFPAPKIVMSKIHMKIATFTGPKQHVPGMRKIVNIAKNVNFTTGDQFSTSWSRIFGSWIIDEVIAAEVLRNMGFATMAVMICTFLLVANVQICFWVFICVILSMVNVCGFMQRWGLTIDLVTCVALQMAIGLCVDYATHIGYTFLTIREGTRNERALTTAADIGSAVLYGGFSTLISVLMLAFSEAYNFQVFFRIFLLEVLFGLFHGVVLLPVILSLIGPKPYHYKNGK